MQAPSAPGSLRAVLFDLDGVLVDSYRVWFHVLNGVARRLGYPPIPDAVYHACWGQGMQADVERFFPRESVTGLERHYAAEYPGHLQHLERIEGAAELLAALRERGLPRAVVTNSPTPLAERCLAQVGLAPDLVVGGSDVPRAKPAPDLLHEACRRLEVGEDDVLFVGDTQYDREAARRAGVRFVGLGIDGDVRIEALGELLAHAGGEERPASVG